MEQNKWYRAIKIIIILFILAFIASGIFSLFMDDLDFQTGNVAIIPIKGVIMSDEARLLGQSVASSTSIINLIEEADRNLKIKGIIFEINSPGGSAVASEEIVNAIQKVNKTTVAWVREIGASGGYWVASACDEIVANRMSIVGSIGVIASYLEFSGFLEDHNVTYQRMVAGKYKDMGSPFKGLSKQEENLLQKQLDKMHDYFISSVASNRNLPEKKVRDLATGMIYIGEDSVELGLIDHLGGKDEAIDIMEEKLNTTAELVYYKKEKSLVDILSGIFSEQSFSIGQGIGSSLFNSRKVSRLEVWT